jgi:methyl-accepting chemotaxis protein
MQKQFVRKQYLIDRRFQLKWAGRIFLLLFMVSFVVGWAIYYAVWDATTSQLKGLVAQGVLSQSQILPVSSTIKSSIAFALLSRSAAILLILSILTIFLTHRIAGPIFKIKKIVRLVRGGQGSERIFLRKRDEFKDLAEDLNALLDHLQGIRT